MYVSKYSKSSPNHAFCNYVFGFNTVTCKPLSILLIIMWNL